MGRGRHALEDARLAQRPWPLQLLADRLDPGRDLFEFFTLNPGSTLQHGTDFPKFLSRGLKATFALGNIETYPQDFIYLTSIIVDACVGPEYPNFLTVAQYVLIDTEGIAVRVALQPVQKAGRPPTWSVASGTRRLWLLLNPKAVTIARNMGRTRKWTRRALSSRRAAARY